jgi:hypothetical protein
MNDLNQRLSHEAEQFSRRGGTELEISQVLARAGEIRRGRRMRATLLMAACVLAVAVPTVLVATDHGGAEQPTPAHEVKRDLSPLRLDGLEQGRAPRTGYVVGNAWHAADGTSTDLAASGSVRAVVRLGSRFLVETDTIEGPLRVAVVPTPPTFIGQSSSWPGEGGLAASQDGDLAAFVQPDGTPVVVQDEGQVSVELPTIEDGSGFDAVAVTGTDCKSPSDSVCAVWVNSSGKAPQAWVSTPEGASRVRPAPGSPDMAEPSMWVMDDVLGDGEVAGMIDATDSGSCSEVEAAGGTALWSTCDHQFVSFSPDGKHLSAFPAYFDGAGSSQLSVLDAKDGATVLDLHTVQDAYVGQLVWEDDTHLLAAVGEGTRAAILRIGLDGSREYAVPPVTTQPFESPFTLPTR